MKFIINFNSSCCEKCGAEDDEENYIHWFDIVTIAIQIRKKNKTVIPRNEIEKWMATMERYHSSIEQRFEDKNKTDELEIQLKEMKLGNGRIFITQLSIYLYNSNPITN